jgi:hypothetical protein
MIYCASNHEIHHWTRMALQQWLNEDGAIVVQQNN